MCDSFTEGRIPDANAPGGFTTTTVPLDPAMVRSAIYQRYGAYLDPSGVLDDRSGTLDRLSEEIASSMLQQRERLLDLGEEMIQVIIDEQCPPDTHAEEWDLDALRTAVHERFGFEPRIHDSKGLERESLAESLWGEVEKVIDARETEFSLPAVLFYTRLFYLQEIDERWIEHLKSMEALREGIHLRGYGQKDPKQEYKKEGFVIFGEMMSNIGRNVCAKLFHMQIQRETQGASASASAPPTPQAAPARAARKTIESGGGSPTAPAPAQQTNGGGAAAAAQPLRRAEPKVGRNDPCPCGSGKKYKKCHGAQATV